VGAFIELQPFIAKLLMKNCILYVMPTKTMKGITGNTYGIDNSLAMCKIRTELINNYD